MYTSFFGFTKKPFSLTPDSEFLFLSSKHKRALTVLQYGLESQAGFTVLTGEIGSGKTILMQYVLKNTEHCEIGLINNTHEAFGDLLTWVLNAFGIQQSTNNKAERYQLFANFVMSKYGQNKRVILFIDEAQNMDIQTMEELRLLSNINTGQDVMLQLVLVGQPELAIKLALPELVQFSQRISIEYHLTALDFEETKQYIQHRLRIVEGNIEIFNEMAAAVVFYYSAGIPRIINNICDLSLVFAFADDKETVDMGVVLDVIKEKKNGGIAQVTLNEREDTKKVQDYVLEETGVDIAILNDK